MVIFIYKLTPQQDYKHNHVCFSEFGNRETVASLLLTIIVILT